VLTVGPGAPEIMHRTSQKRQQSLAPLESGIHSPHDTTIRA